MVNAASSGTSPKSPNSQKKIALLSLGTCILLGIVGFEVFQEKNDRNLSLPSQNFLHPQPNSQNEQLLVELNQANQNINQLKRQLFVRNSAPISAYNKKLQEDFASKEKSIQELSEAIKTNEAHLDKERAKVATLESSLAALADLIEIQKNSKERFHDTLKQTVESKDDELEQFKGTLAEAHQQIAALKEQIANELAEKQSLVEALEINAALHHETKEHLVSLNDEIAIDRTVHSLATETIKAEHQESLNDLRLELDKLQSLLESTQVQLENEYTIKENANQTVLALVNKSCLLEAELSTLNEKKTNLEETRREELKELGEKGAALEDELIFAKAARAIEVSRLADNHSAEIESLEKNYREICATCKELESEYSHLTRQVEDFRNKNNAQLSDTLSDKSDTEELLLFAQLENKLAQERMTIELEDISYALIAAEHQRDLSKRNLEDHLVIYEEERKESASKIAELDAELHAERLEKQQLLSQLAETHLVKETEAGFTAEVSQELERAYAYQDALKEQINTHQALVLEKQEAWDAAVNQHKLELAALEEKHIEVQGDLEKERAKALEHKESTDQLTASIKETEAALEAANLAFQKLEQESLEKIRELNDALNSKENAYADVSENKTKIEQQTRELEQAKELQNAYIADLEKALKNAETGLNHAAAALELYDTEITVKSASLNEHAERKEALETELNHHKDALARSSEIEQNLKQELENVLVQANQLSIQITTLENALQQKEGSSDERIAQLENALEEARLALENEVRLLKEQHAQEISLAGNMHVEAKENAEVLSQKIAHLETELRQKEGSSEERIAHLQQALKETEESLTNNIRTLESEHQQKVFELHSQKDDLEASLKKDLEKALAEAEALSAELKTKQGSSEEQISHLEKTLEETKASLLNNLRALEEEHERKVAELNETLAISDTLSQELKRKEIQEDALKHDLEQTRIQSDNLNRDLLQKENDKNAVQERIEQHERKIAELEARHQEAIAISDSLSQELKRKEIQEDALKHELEQSRIQSDNLNRDLLQKDTDKNSIQETIEQHERKIAELEARHQEAIALSDTLSHELKQKEIQESALKHDLEQSRIQSDNLNRDLLQKENDKNAVQEAINQRDMHIDQLQQEHQQKLTDLHLQKEDTEAKLKQELDNALAKTEALHSELKQKEEAHQAAKADVELYQTNFEALEQALVEVRESLIQSVQQLKEKHSQEVALIENTAESQKAQIELELRNLAASKEQLAERYNEAIQSIQQLQDEVNAKDGSLQANTDQVNHLRLEIEHVQNSLASEKKQSEDLLLQLETIKSQYDSAQTSLEEKASLEAKLQSLSDALEDQADELNQLKAVKDALETEVKEAKAKQEEAVEIF